MFTSAVTLRSAFLSLQLRCKGPPERARKVLRAVGTMSGDLATGKKAAAVKAVDDYVTVSYS